MSEAPVITAERAALAAEREGLLHRLREVEAALGVSGRTDMTMDLRSSMQAILDAQPAHIALLDPEGRVVLDSEAWRRFAVANPSFGDAFVICQDYLSLCTGALGDCADEAMAASHGIRAVLAGELPQFVLEYPCHCPGEKRWFRMRVTPIHPTEPRGCLVMHLDITERRLAEEEVRANEARLRAILDADPDCVKAVSRDGRILSINAAGVRMFGVASLSGIIGQSMLDFIHPEDRSRYSSFHEGVLAGGGGVLRYRILNARGEVKLVESHSTPLRDGDGKISSRVCVTSDITEQKAAEDRLADLRQLTRHVLDSVGEGIQGVGLDGRIQFSNPAAEAILGWRKDEMVGKIAHALVHHHHPDGRLYPHAECPIFQTLRDGLARRVDDEYFFHRDGRAIPVEYVVTPVCESDGRLQGAVVCFQDISRRLASQMALAQSEERFRLVARATANAIWDWDVASDAIIWNNGLQDLFGYEGLGEQSSLQFWADCVHPDDRVQVVESLKQSLGGATDIWEREYRFRRHDGSYAFVMDRGFVVRDSGGKAIRMVGGMTDISDKRALEAQLRASQRLEAVGQLTGGLAHDFNNLLTVVLGNAELLEERFDQRSAERELVGMILAAAQRGSGLTQRLLAFSRRQALESRPLCLGELVQGMNQLIRGAVGDEIILVVSAAKDQGCVLADAAQLENALLNLCINARDAMPGGGELRIAVSEMALAPPDIDPLSVSEYGDYVCLEVSDTGTGIPEDILPLVIEPFFTTKEQGKGTGLGLSMVYGLVKQSSGFMEIRSQPGVGTSILIYLPRNADASAPADEDPQLAAIPRGSERILLVEDDALVRRHAHLQLSGLGYEVTVAEDGAQALEVLKGTAPIDLLLTDVLMPGGINGAQLAEAARALRPGLRILLSSGYSMDALSSEGRLPEGVLMLAKPYKKGELAQRVRKALS